MDRIPRSLLLLAALMAPVAAADAQNIVANGGFETPDAPENTFSTHSGSVGAWTIASGNVDLIDDGFWQPDEGVQSIDLNGTAPATIFQNLATTPGTLYNLFFALAGNPGGFPSKSLDVFWNGLLAGAFTFDATGRSSANMGWQTESIFGLAATSSSTELRFQSTTPNCCSGPALDDVVVSAALRSQVVPEPMSMILLGTGLLGIAGARRWRRRHEDAIA